MIKPLFISCFDPSMLLYKAVNVSEDNISMHEGFVSCCKITIIQLTGTLYCTDH